MNLSSTGQRACGVWIIASVYVYFLIFAEFAFLRLAQAQGLTGQQLRFVMGCMGVAGIGASLFASRACTEARSRWLLIIGFVGSALAAAVSLAAHDTVFFAASSALIGGFLGVLTVSLVGNLPRFFPTGQRGTLIGLGTGLAYAVCNVPAVFAGSPVRQTALAIAGCVAGAVCSTLADHARAANCRPPPTPAPRNEARLAFPPLAVIFLALIWLDSAAFYILQNTPALNQFGWGSTALQWNNAVIHLVVAVLAGVWLDRGGLDRVLLLAFASLAGAAVCVSAPTPAAQLTHWLYAAGVSLYSVALVFTPGVGLDGQPLQRSVVRAGVLYAVAGWAGSALGIGMAQDLRSIPLWFVGLATLAFVCSWVWLVGSDRRASVRRAAIVIGIGTAIFTVARTSSSRVRLQPHRAGEEPSIERGREVYISEGCIHCHSQYVRAGTFDAVWWGPAANAEQVRREQPPLIGNRRQGPDLMNVGNRRSPTWNRLHLMDPRAVSPNSRMPSYAHLFAPGDGRGEALLLYLADLGGDTAAPRSEIRVGWQPRPDAHPIQGEAQAALFQQSCRQCHGADGKGNGLLADQLGTRRPRDLTRAEWQFIPARDTPADRRLELARVIKFGIAGTSMPGHEYFNDSQVLGLADYIQSLYVPAAAK